ncbi:hypothetical protein K8I61_14785 [bacterium]|nr:hypothetical protein [bacterium]
MPAIAFAMTIGCVLSGCDTAGNADTAVVPGDSGEQAGGTGASLDLPADERPHLRRDASGEERPEPNDIVDIETVVGDDWDCTDPGTCVDDYLRFIDRAAGHADPIPADELAFMLDIKNHPSPLDIGTPILREALTLKMIEGLRIGFLVDGFAQRRFSASVISREVKETVIEEQILFTDLYVGRFKGLLIRPKAPGRYPAIAAMHGHGDNPWVMRDQYHALKLAERGYVVLVLWLRVNYADAFENLVSMELLSSGFTFPGLRVYEGMLAVRYLRARPDVRADSIGFYGHSGGAVTGNALAWIDPHLKAVVSDCDTLWLQPPGDSPGPIDDTAPDLYRYSAIINERNGYPPIPMRVEPYGYTDGFADVFDFFERHLK